MTLSGNNTSKVTFISGMGFGLFFTIYQKPLMKIRALNFAWAAQHHAGIPITVG